MRLLRTGIASAMAWLALAPAGLACSMYGHYVVPSNFELVDMADAIVVATAVSETGGDHLFDNTVSFKVESALKGQPPATFDDRGSVLGQPIPSDPHALDGANPEAYGGPCSRMTFAKGKSYVIFMVNDPEYGWRPMGYAFARVNEDYFGPDSLWVRTIETYVDVERKFGPMEQIDELERMLEAKMKEPPSRYRDIEAADIVDHLRSRSPYKPTEYLLETYRELERGEAPRFPVRPPSADAERSDAQAITDFLFNSKAPDALSREEEMEFVLNSLVEGDHPGAMALFDRLLAAENPRASDIGLGLRFMSKHGRMREAFDYFEARALPLLVRASTSEAMYLIGAMTEAMNGDDYEDPLWRRDTYTRERWPALAFDLQTFQVRIVGEDDAFNFTEELEELRPDTFREWPEWTLARARDFDQDVEAWAIAEVADRALLESHLAALKAYRLGSGDVELPVDPALLPLQALVSGFGEERDAALRLAFCQGLERRRTLIDALSYAQGLDTDLVEAMFASPSLNMDERSDLLDIVAGLHGRQVDLERRKWSAGYFWNSYDWEDLLVKAARGEPMQAPPITCPST